MFPRIQGLIQTVLEKRLQNDNCAQSSVTLAEQKKMEDDSSSSESVEIENKDLPMVERQSLESEETHSTTCTCPNCDEVLSRFTECTVCLEPIQCFGPCICTSCGGFWCTRCSPRLSKCIYCRTPLRSPANACLALERLINQLKLPCRNSRRGCTELLTASTRANHEEDCLYDLLTCPLNTEKCCSALFEDIASHLRLTHNVTAIRSQKIKILIEQFQEKLKNTACCKTKYKIVLLHEKSAFIIKVCIYNYHVRVEIMRRRLGYIADNKSMDRGCEYGATVEFHSKAVRDRAILPVANECYGKKTEVQWTDVMLRNDRDESISIHVNIGKNFYTPAFVKKFMYNRVQ